MINDVAQPHAFNNGSTSHLSATLVTLRALYLKKIDYEKKGDQIGVNIAARFIDVIMSNHTGRGI